MTTTANAIDHHGTISRHRQPLPRLVLCLLVVLAGILVTIQGWIDIYRIAHVDEEASHVWLVPIVAAWLLWVRRDQLPLCPLRTSVVGPAFIAFGAILSQLGYAHAIQTFWHAGAVLVLIGCVVTVLGWQLFWRLLPAFAVLAFLVPVPGMLRMKFAIPLQTATAIASQFALDLLGLEVFRSGNVLTYNDVPVAVAEACNGMRMVFSLALVAYAYAFATPLRNSVRVILVLASPLLAIACNVIRLLPSVWVYGHYPESTAEQFHDLAGWVMLAVAFFLLMSVTAILRWAQIPVMQPKPLASESPSPTPHFSIREGAIKLFVALFVLSAIAVTALARPPAADAEPYHQRVQLAAEAMPTIIGDWVGSDSQPPQSAVKMLRPNVLISREFLNEKTGRHAALLFVHCKDARDLAGHFPLICYPANGWSIEHTEPAQWEVGGLTIPGTEYHFAFHRPNGVTTMFISNFIIMPDGTLLPDMHGVQQAAADYQRHFFGAAQIQIAVMGDVTAPERRQIFQQLIGANLPIIHAIGSAWE